MTERKTTLSIIGAGDRWPEIVDTGCDIAQGQGSPGVCLGLPVERSPFNSERGCLFSKLIIISDQEFALTIIFKVAHLLQLVDTQSVQERVTILPSAETLDINLNSHFTIVLYSLGWS